MRVLGKLAEVAMIVLLAVFVGSVIGSITARLWERWRENRWR